MFVFFFAGCKKGDKTPSNPIDQLPPATQTGANTLGCLIDGKLSSVNGKSYFGHETGVDFLAVLNSAWYLKGKVGYQGIYINFDYNANPGVPKTFEVSNNYPAGAEHFNPTDGNTAITGGNDFKTDSVHKGALNLLYYDGKIASGTFSFDSANDAGTVIHITDGRFDVSL